MGNANQKKRLVPDVALQPYLNLAMWKLRAVQTSFNNFC